MNLPFYYKVGDKKIANQLEAIQTFHKTKEEFVFCLFEEQYDKIDWTVEPTESWAELSRQRAQQIRDKYKKVKLHFSAGSDSTHVLRSFLDNKIFLDELVVIDYTYNPLRHYECQNLIIPAMQRICAENPGMKYSVIQIDRDFYEDWFKQPDWLEQQGRWSGQLTFSPNDWTAFVQRCDRDQILGTDVCHIRALEKPRLVIEDGKWYFRPLDKQVEHQNPTFGQQELFHFAPDFPKLFVKQCWMLINYIEEKMPNIGPHNLSMFYDSHGPYYDKFVEATGRGKPYIYVLGNGRNKYTNLTGWPHNKMRDYAAGENWESYKRYKLMMDEFAKKSPEMFNKGDPYYGFVGVHGNKRFIKEYTPRASDTQRASPIIFL